ncbi:hypothetical protein [Streptomyces sp. NPDC047071]|uniref:hypothetical protein n=1 Tax=Streptomyces sp. NPDC047071 TaxID=3154808 RepID=UPI00345403EF
MPRVLTAWAQQAAGQCGKQEAVAVTDAAYARVVQEQGADGMHTLYAATVCLAALLTSLQAAALGTPLQSLLDGIALELHQRAAG